ncbi:type III pantothenate kinase [Aliiglaciecola sp. LCG003]|uniref:type III pantothenate kinase n=1 Tax=Aliiglaciecola sp. LCG003 TaxID=3053655 RepID=UPI002572416E|nr:type III pantothenate kinase [Aliiglaciecola sp. LCG003]WJG08838.1 type III pantothenate kinase [Aliiglaciecola sp. LCG003]
MSGQDKSLLIDIGNSRIKFALVDRSFIAGEGAPIESKVCENLEGLKLAIMQADEVVVASVQKDQVLAQLFTQLEQQNKTCKHIVTESRAFGIECAYQQYQNLGIDRWLAVLGARLHTALPVAVIDLGTAATCDVLVGNQHVGGWIAPGFHLQKEVISQRAAKVFSNEAIPTNLQFGTGTEDCVNFGCLAMLEGFISSAEKMLKQYGDEYKVFICGGDAKLLGKFSRAAIEIKPNLVLEGLSRFA